MNKTKAIALAVAALMGAASGATFAQGHDNDRHDNGRHEGWNNPNNPHYNGHRGDERDAGRFHYGARGAEWHRGGRIPSEYRNRQYVVTDWRAHRLYAPPRGYQWVQVGGDYVLVAIATGIIANLILNG